ncbi:hypothetical protein L6R49_23310, partial [Myxococcota bacterium]|nr:hypothetical protein [Myxococcota bacterium]
MPRARALLTALLLSACLAPVAEAACPMRPDHAAAAAKEVMAQFTAQAPNQRRTELTVSCLSAVPTPAQSAAIYVANGIIQAQLGEEQAALLWLQAMVEADPTAQLSPTLAPPDHALFALYARALEQPPSTRGAAPIPRNHTLWVDGVEAQGVPLERPALVVLTDKKGEVVWSELVAPGADLKREWRVLAVQAPLVIIGIVLLPVCYVAPGFLMAWINSD